MQNESTLHPGRMRPGDLARDLRFAVRALRRTPAFSAVAIVSLACGLALTAATLAVTNAYLIRGLPYPDGKRLYHVMYAPPGPLEPRGMSAVDWDSVRDVVDASVTSSGETYYINDAGLTQIARAMRVSSGFIEGLGVRPVIGQSFSEQAFIPGSPMVALIGHAFWRDQFNSDPKVVGCEIHVTPENPTLGPELLRVAGVLPPGFWFGRTSSDRVEILVPLRTPTRTYMVRLREGVPVDFAERRITEAAKAVGSAFPTNWTGVHLESVHGRYVAELRPLLLRINAAAGLVLVLVCTNVAVLILLRAFRRQKEMAVRVALGAEPHHLVRLLGAEAGLICIAALTLGLALLEFALRTLAPVIETQLGKPPPGGTAEIAIDSTVVVAIGGVTLLIALSLACIPMLAPRQRQLADTLRRTGQSATDGPTMLRLRSTLIALEVAGALVLLVGGGLMIRSVLNLVHIDFGYDPDKVARARIVLPGRTYRDAAALAQFYAQLEERLSRSNSVVAVSSSFPPYYETFKQPLESGASSGPVLQVGVLAVGAHYFEVHGIPLREGREFTLADRLGTEPIAVISETLARQLWPEGSAVGRRIRTGEEPNPGSPLGTWRTVVGVVRDVRQTYTDTDLKDVYLPFLQAPTRFAAVQFRTDRAAAFRPANLAPIVREIDPFVRVNDPQLLSSENAQFARIRFLTTLLSGFAGFAALLALLGIYGVTAYAVQQREREVAIRLAIGASQANVTRRFLAEGGTVLGAGIALGLFATMGAGRILESQIHGVQLFDFPTLVAASLFMAVTGLLATWWPVRRAATGNLLMVLKEE